MDNLIENIEEKKPLIMRYLNKYYKAPEHIKTEEEFLVYLQKNEREYYDFISNENLKINYGRFNIINWDGSEEIKNQLRTIAKTELYDLYKPCVDLEYIKKYFGFNKPNETDYFNDEDAKTHINKQNYNKQVYNKKINKNININININIEESLNYMSNSDNDNRDDEEIFDDNNIINDKDYESD